MYRQVTVNGKRVRSEWDRGDTYQTYYVHKYFYIRVGTFHHTLRVKHYIQYYPVITERGVYRQKLRARLPNVFVRSTETVPLEMFARPPKANAQHNIIYENSKCQRFPTLRTPTYVMIRSIPKDTYNTDMYVPLQSIPEDTHSQITLKRGIWEVRNYERNFFLTGTGTDHDKVRCYLYEYDRKNTQMLLLTTLGRDVRTPPNLVEYHVRYIWGCSHTQIVLRGKIYDFLVLCR